MLEIPVMDMEFREETELATVTCNHLDLKFSEAWSHLIWTSAGLGEGGTGLGLAAPAPSLENTWGLPAVSEGAFVFPRVSSCFRYSTRTQKAL